MEKGTNTPSLIQPRLNIALQDWRTADLMEKEPVRLLPEVYKGNLVFHIPGKAKRYYYTTIRKGLIKQNVLITVPTPF